MSLKIFLGAQLINHQRLKLLYSLWRICLARCFQHRWANKVTENRVFMISILSLLGTPLAVITATLCNDTSNDKVGIMKLPVFGGGKLNCSRYSCHPHPAVLGHSLVDVFQTPSLVVTAMEFPLTNGGAIIVIAALDVHDLFSVVQVNDSAIGENETLVFGMDSMWL